MAKHLYYIEELTTEGSQQAITFSKTSENVDSRVIRIEKISKLDADSIEKGELLNTESNQFHIPITTDDDSLWYQDRFIVSDKTHMESMDDLENAKPGGLHEYAIQIRNAIRKKNKDIQGYSTLLGNANSSKLVTKVSWYMCALNVGHGDCTVIVSPERKTYVVDFGYTNQNADKKLSLFWDYLNRTHNLNVRKEISGFFISHADRDHYGGFVQMFSNISKSRDCFLLYNYLGIYGGKNWANTLNFISREVSSGQIRLITIPNSSSGQSLINLIPGLQLNYLWPFSNSPHKFCISHVSKNNSSVSFMLSDQSGIRTNFVGDIEQFTWDQILNTPVNMKLFKNYRGCNFKYSHHARTTGNYFNRGISLNHALKKSMQHVVASTALSLGHPSLCSSVQLRDVTFSSPIGIVYEFCPNGSINRQAI